ncbi:MAG: oxidoreductase [Spirochaetaceae bacterium]|nr:oxidoreductase [Spirochaetaceae bacterium]|tara:strand:+ start:23794 stop:25035 length:1242 start_codon:yes stop_codon:yes gene_type:complete
MKQIVILGGGTAGTMMAHHLSRKLNLKQWQVTLVDPEPRHYYQPGYLFIPFGIYKENDIVKDRGGLLPATTIWIQKSAEIIDAEKNEIRLQDGDVLNYDILVIATGSHIAPEETEGMLGPEWRKSIFDFYSIDGANALYPAMESFRGGNLVVHVNEMPIKCPVAPLEFSFLADYFFRKKGIREKMKITYVTPLGGAFTKPVASAALGHLMSDKEIDVVADYTVEHIDNESKKLVSYDGREVPFDLLVTVPTNMGDPLMERSDLGDELNFVPVDKHTLQAKEKDNIFVIGDATDVPTSKAGSVGHFEGELLIENIQRYIQGKELEPSFDGHANCFIESGHRKGLLIDFNYDQEPVPGKFPIAGIGPLSLLRENRMNHLGKMAFKWIYWNMIVKARKIPMVPARMSTSGKKIKST